MTDPERRMLKALLASAKGGRDVLQRIGTDQPPEPHEIRRARVRLEKAIGTGEAMLDGAGYRGSE